MAERGAPPPWRNRRVRFGGFVLLLLIVLALAAPLIAPHDPLEQDLLSSFLPPFWRDGADPQLPSRYRQPRPRHSLAPDLWRARGAHGRGGRGQPRGPARHRARPARGLFPRPRRRRDLAARRYLDVVSADAAVGGAGGRGRRRPRAVILAIIFVDWTRFCRIVRAEVLVQREQDYIVAAVTIGLGRARVLGTEILPNLVPTLLVLFGLEMGSPSSSRRSSASSGSASPRTRPPGAGSSRRAASTSTRPGG